MLYRQQFSGVTPLSDEELYGVAPSIFATEKHGTRSDRYAYIPTIDIVNGLRKEGFQPFWVSQSRSRDVSKREHTKHMLRLRPESRFNDSETGEIILINSHDGSSSYKMMCGVYRFVCGNGMILGDTVEEICVQHRGNIVHDVIDAAYSIVEDFDTAQEEMETMKSTNLSLPDREAFAAAALTLKYDDVKKAPISPYQVLATRRAEDKKDDLWTVFSRVQENVIKGGQSGRSATTGQRRTTRPVQSIDNNVKLNKALWVLAMKMAEIKS